MATLSFLHRWTGAFIGLLLAVMGLTGTILLWEESWIGLPGTDAPLSESVSALGSVTTTLADAGGAPLSRITFAKEDFGLHLAIYADGSGAYADQDGAIVTRWAEQWERPELWLFDLHHHLFTGETGETVTGIAGLIGLFFVVSGSILWWRTRRTFVFRLWPNRMTPSAIVRQHRDLGIVAAPLLIVSMTTGTLMLFPAINAVVLAPLTADTARAAPVSVPRVGGAMPGAPDFAAIYATAKARFPDAAIRRIQLPAKPGDPVTLRLRQRFEWTPNGRTTLTFDAASARLIDVANPADGDVASAITETYYPIHSAKIGGFAWKIAMTLSGLALTLLGLLATIGFWMGQVGQPSISNGAPVIDTPFIHRAARPAN